MASITYRPQDIIQLDFMLNIDGTNYKPSEVKILIINGKKTYGTIADNVDNHYKAEFDLSSIHGLKNDDKLELVIEIHINGRVFRPYKRQLEIIDYTEVGVNADTSNQALDTDIQHQEIKEEAIIEEKVDQKVVNDSKPYTQPSWAKDILNGKDIPKDLDTQFKKVEKAVAKETPDFIKPKKISIKFEKPKNKKVQVPKIEISIPEEIQFTANIKKRSLQKRKEIQPFVITEGKIKYV